MDNELYEAIIQQANIIDVISSFNIRIEKSGRSYKALCPFHNDKHPSMHISPEKRIWKCFSCGEGGNVITFVSKFKNESYEEAARDVANIIGFHDPRLNAISITKSKDPDLEKLKSTINDLQKYYVYCLSTPEAEKARQYLEKRGINQDQIVKYGIGYSPLDGVKTIKFLQAKGHSLKSIEDIGIALVRSEGTSDHNSGRLIFPLSDRYGQVVGFSARQLEKDDSAKYINSPETRLFHKGSILYNYHNVVLSAKKDGYCYVLEGFMDVMALEKSGLNNAVALMGTAFTDDQIALLSRLKCEIRLCLDGDEPGQMAMMKMLPALKKSGINFKLVDYEGDLRDPDDIFDEEGAEGVKKRMNNLVEPFDFQLGYYLHTKKLSNADDKNKLITSSISFLTSITSPIELENYFVKLSNATGYEVSAIRNIFNQYKENSIDEIETPYYFEEKLKRGFKKNNKRNKRLDEAEKTILAMMLIDENAIDFFKHNVHFFYNDLYQDIANYLLDYKDTHKEEKVDLSLLTARFDENPSSKELSDIVSDIAFSSEDYSKTSLTQCESIINEERKAEQEKEKAIRGLSSSSNTEQGKALAEYASNIRERWKRKQNK